MIGSPIKTAFSWYDDIEKQNRYKGACETSCGYKLLSPLNSLLPFQIRTDENNVSVESWKIHCLEDDSETVDLSSEIASLVVETIDDQDYIYYLGSDLPSLLLPCGDYYSVIATNGYTYYSEIFHAEDIDDVSFIQSKFPLFTPWRWYDNQQKQNRYKGACQADSNFYLLTGTDALLPFMFRKPTGVNTINSWVLRNIDETCQHNLSTSLLNITTIGSYDYIYHYGILNDGDELPCGIYESIITINGVEYFSELIKITNDISNNNFYILQENGFRILQESNFGLFQE